MNAAAGHKRELRKEMAGLKEVTRNWPQPAENEDIRRSWGRIVSFGLNIERTPKSSDQLVVFGTDIPVESILARSSDAEMVEPILEQYSDLRREDVLDVFAYSKIRKYYVEPNE